MNVSTTSSSKSCNGFCNLLSVTKPSGLNLSPILNEWPALAIAKSDISNILRAAPTLVLAAPTPKLSSRFLPVASVKPTPNLETPVIGTFS